MDSCINSVNSGPGSGLSLLGAGMAVTLSDYLYASPIRRLIRTASLASLSRSSPKVLTVIVVLLHRDLDMI